MNEQLAGKIIVDRLIQTARNKGYVLFQGAKDYHINIWGIRGNTDSPNLFDDVEVVFWYFNGKWVLKVYPICTHPGVDYLLNPMNAKGAAILKPNQYLGCWAKGKHQGKYPALVQVKPMTVVRDFDKDNQLDLNTGVEETGLFGINNHRASEHVDAKIIGKWSAGCQVFQKHDDFNEFMGIVDASIPYYGNSFSYTLIDEKDLAV